MPEIYRSKTKAYLVKPTKTDKTIYRGMAGYELLNDESSLLPFHQLVIPKRKVVVGHFTLHGIPRISKYVFHTQSSQHIENYNAYLTEQNLEIVKEYKIPRGRLEALIHNMENITKDPERAAELIRKENQQLIEILK